MLFSEAMGPVALVEKLPAWIHLVTLIVASLYAGFTVLAHVPWITRYPKAKLFFTRAGSWFGDLRRDLLLIDATLRPAPPPSPPSPPAPEPEPSKDEPKSAP